VEAVGGSVQQHSANVERLCLLAKQQNHGSPNVTNVQRFVVLIENKDGFAQSSPPSLPFYAT
jgi:hypothetical protein